MCKKQVAGEMGRIDCIFITSVWENWFCLRGAAPWHYNRTWFYVLLHPCCFLIGEEKHHALGLLFDWNSLLALVMKQVLIVIMKQLYPHSKVELCILISYHLVKFKTTIKNRRTFHSWILQENITLLEEILWSITSGNNNWMFRKRVNSVKVQ